MPEKIYYYNSEMYEVEQDVATVAIAVQEDDKGNMISEEWLKLDTTDKFATVSTVHVPSAMPNFSIRGTGAKKKKSNYKFSIPLQIMSIKVIPKRKG